MSFAGNITEAVNRARNFLIMLHNLPQIHLKLPQKSNSKTADTTGDLIGNKIANEITKVSKTSPQNISETVESETEIPKE